MINNNLEDKYREYSIMHFNASQSGDYKLANKMYNKLTKIYKKLELDENFSKIFLGKFLNDPEDSVKLWACSHCLGLKIFIEQSINNIIQISKQNSKNSPSFEARMTLKVWNEQGFLKFY